MHNAKIRNMVVIAFLVGLVLVLQLLGGVIPPIGGFSISLVLIPIVMGAVLLGPGAGALLGAIFGVIVFVNCVTGADPGGVMVFQASPVLCFLVVMAKGTLAGWLSGLCYRLLRGRNPHLAMICAAAVCPIVNTGVFIGCMLTIFPQVLAAWAGGSDILSYVLTGLLLVNFVPELIINVLFGTVGHTILRAVRK